MLPFTAEEALDGADISAARTTAGDDRDKGGLMDAMSVNVSPGRPGQASSKHEARKELPRKLRSNGRSRGHRHRGPGPPRSQNTRVEVLRAGCTAGPTERSGGSAGGQKDGGVVGGEGCHSERVEHLVEAEPAR